MKFGLFYEHQVPRPWTADSEHRLSSKLSTRWRSPTGSASNTSGRSSTTSSRNTRTRRRPRSSWPPLAADLQHPPWPWHHPHAAALQPSGPRRRAHRHARSGVRRPRRVGHRRVGHGSGDARLRDRPEAEDHDVAGGHRAGRQHAGDDAVPGLQRRVLRDALPEHGPEAVQRPILPSGSPVPAARRSTVPPASGSVLWRSRSSSRRWRPSGCRSTTTSSSRPTACRSGTRSIPNVAIVSGFSVHQDGDEADPAQSRRLPLLRLLARPLRHLRPAPTGPDQRLAALHGGEGSAPGQRRPWRPRQARPVREHLERYEHAGIDQVIFVQQSGNNRHEHICESLELFAHELLPEFKRRDETRQRRKQDELAPYVAAALERKPRLAPLSEAEVPMVEAFGRQVEGGFKPDPTRGGAIPVVASDPLPTTRDR